MPISALVSMSMLVIGSSSWAQIGAGSVDQSQQPMLMSLERPGDFESRRSSSADPNWQDGNGDCRPIPAGETLTLAELEGPGRITHIWFTIASGDPYYPRNLVLRMYWDDREEPSVECPIGDFFAVGHGMDVPVDSIPVAVSSEGRARNCYWPMPFGKKARITVTNDSPDHDTQCIFWYIDWQKLPSLPEDTMYFHAQYRQEYPCQMGQDYLIFDGQGDGVYVGTVQSVQLASLGWYGEGDDRFFIDGATEPQLRGTGTEDYFCDAWGFRQLNKPFYGVSVMEGYQVDDRITAYRWHIPDPVRFKQSLKVTIEHKGAVHDPDGTLKSGFQERPDYMSTVAYWYQRGVAKPFATIPPVSERVLAPTRIEAEEAVREGRVKSSAAPLVVQGGSTWSGGGQLFFRPIQQDAWLELPFEVPTDGRYILRLDATISFDYGKYQIYLDGEKIGPPRDFYNPGVSERSEKLGVVELAGGPHTLRFECVGASPESKNQAIGEPGYFLGIDAIEYRKLPSQ